MRFQWSIFAASVLLLSSVLAWEEPQNCFWACQDPLGYLIFNGTGSNPGDDWSLQHCANELKFKSLYVCLRHYCNPRDIKKGVTRLAEICIEEAATEITPISIVDDISDSQAMQLRMVSKEDIDAGETIDEVVLVSTDLFQLAWKTNVRSLPLSQYFY